MIFSFLYLIFIKMFCLSMPYSERVDASFIIVYIQKKWKLFLDGSIRNVGKIYSKKNVRALSSRRLKSMFIATFVSLQLTVELRKLFASLKRVNKIICEVISESLRKQLDIWKGINYFFSIKMLNRSFLSCLVAIISTITNDLKKMSWQIKLWKTKINFPYYGQVLFLLAAIFSCLF